MPQLIKSTPIKFPDADTLTLGNFKRGVITLINESRLPKNALKQAQNLFLYEDGQPGPRAGTGWFGATTTVTTTTAKTVPSAAAGTNWTTPTNVYGSDNTYAVHTNVAQDDLKITGFGFNVPTTATITGVTVYVEGNGADATAANRSIELGMTKTGSALAGSRLASQNLNQTADTTLTFGNSTNLFSTTLTPTELNTSTWGIMLRPANISGTTVSIDQVTVAITYTNAEAIDGFDYYDANGSVHLVVAAGGYILRSTNDGLTWSQCNISGGVLPTYTKGTEVNMNQNQSFLYLTTGNGVDLMERYDGSTTLQQYSTLATPSAPTVAKTGLAATTYTYWYKVSQVDAVGYTTASSGTSIGVDRPRDSWDTTANYVTISGTVSTSATRVDIYESEDNTNFYYLDSAVVDSGTGNYTYRDNATAAVVPSTIAPTSNTTQGPQVAELSNIGTRQFGVRDYNMREKIWWTGTGQQSGAFAGAYDGGYLIWQRGGKYWPVTARDYRTGKGDSIATVWMNSADGQGGILQLSLDVLTIDQANNITITVPNAYMLPGSRGTPAPHSVVNVLNDFMFYNNQAFYNLGNRQDLLNILSTDEASSNIRPSVQQITRAAENKIASIYYYANVYISYPAAGSTTNNRTAIYNTEMKAWMPEAFMTGFSKFLRYTDTSGSPHLLCYKPGDSRLTEISPGFGGDYLQPFQTSLTTGLFATTKDSFAFQFTEEGEFELANTGGNITVSLLGYDRSKGYKTIKTVNLTGSTSVSGSGWDTYSWDSVPWDYAVAAPTLVSEPSSKRYFPVQKELNTVQWNIVTNDVNARYILRTLQTWGTPSQDAHPSNWRLKPV